MCSRTMDLGETPHSPTEAEWPLPAAFDPQEPHPGIVGPLRLCGGARAHIRSDVNVNLDALTVLTASRV
jgi:hypothetical protein